MKNVIAWSWVLTCGLAVLPVRAETPGRVEAKADAPTLVGDWYEYFSPDFSSTHTFFADGKYVGVLEIAPRLKQPNVTFEGTWKIEDGHLVYTLTHASDPEILRLKPVVRDGILSVNRYSFTYVCETTEQIRRMTRLPPKKEAPVLP